MDSPEGKSVSWHIHEVSNVAPAIHTPTHGCFSTMLSRQTAEFNIPVMFRADCRSKTIQMDFCLPLAMFSHKLGFRIKPLRQIATLFWFKDSFKNVPARNRSQ